VNHSLRTVLAPALGVLALGVLALGGLAWLATLRCALPLATVPPDAPVAPPVVPAVTTALLLPDDAAAWSGTGAIVALERDGAIEVRDLSRGGAVTARIAGSAPQVLRAGRFLLASGHVVHDLVARRSYPLPGAPVGAAHISPDGGAVAVALEVGDSIDVFLVELRDDEPRLHRLTRRGGGSPRWLSGGRLLYEAAREDGGFGLFLRGQAGLGRERPFWETPDIVPPPQPVAAPPPVPPVVQA
jgi:hypothetical protein